MNDDDLDLPELEVELDESLVREWVDARAARDRAQRDMDHAREQIVKQMQVAPGVHARFGKVAGSNVVRLSTITTARIDTRRLRKEWPDIAEQFTATTRTQRLDMA